MYTLYVRTGCPFCTQVLKVVEDQKIDINIKDTTESGVVEELIAVGGKKQVPFLVDKDKGVSMYESEDIIAYMVSQKSGDVNTSEQDGESDQGGGESSDG